MYAVTNEGIRAATRRITCVREPDSHGVHEQLLHNQNCIRTTLRGEIPQWLRWFRHKLMVLSQDLEVDVVAMRNAWADTPHAKRMLRLRARFAVWSHGRNRGTRLRAIEYKCKTGELLALEKYLRGIGDLGTPASSVLAYYMDTVKMAFSEPFELYGGVAEFIKVPESDLMRYVFTSLWTPPQDVYFPYFSDDSCIAVKCTDGIFRSNVDIKACDGSNYGQPFRLLKEAMKVDTRFYQDIDDCFQQLEEPCFIRNPGGKERIQFTPIGPVLYSGSVLTTSVNNMANTLIFMSFMRLYRQRRPTVAECEGMLRDAASLVGYIVKVAPCQYMEELQFLKHSPSLVDGLVVPWLNVGVWLRGFGSFRGDLPGKTKTPIETRARIFNSDVIKSYVHAGEHAIHDAFNSHKIADSFNQDFEQFRPKTVSGNNTRIPTDSIARRYGCRADEIEELASMIHDCDIFQRIAHPVIDKIMAADYGYG